MQINRLFKIIYILLDKKSITSKELAQQFGVSVRTIYRDVDILSSVGIPIYTEQGKGGGICLLPDFVLNKSILSEDEQQEILSALQGLANVRTAETEQVLQRLSTFFNKEAVNWMDVDFSSWGFVNNGFFNDFKTAILKRRIAQFEYYAIYGQKTPCHTHRRIEPIQLWFKSKAWYIKGFCLTKQSIRTFKLSRIRNLVITDEPFSERELSMIDLAPDSDKEQKERILLKLKIDSEMSHRVYDEFDEKVVAEQPDGSFVVTIKCPEEEWVYSTILSYGEYIEVLEPEHVREVIGTRIEKAAKKYS